MFILKRKTLDYDTNGNVVKEMPPKDIGGVCFLFLITC